MLGSKARHFAIRFLCAAGSAAFAIGLAAGPAAAQTAACQNGADFDTWLSGFKREAAAQGISQTTLASALGDVAYDRSIISKDRGQRVFKQSFEQFSARMVNAGRVSKGKSLMQRHAALLKRVEAQFGVPSAVVVAIWGLETDFGAVSPKLPIFRSLATLTYDCRRSAFFKQHLMDALRVAQRGDMPVSEMRGQWAGEMGQTQFMPSGYYNYAVDFDGDGRRDLIHDTADVLASTANYLKGHGWQRGAGWEPGEPNFNAILQWNKSQVYARTIALFATRLSGGASD